MQLDTVQKTRPGAWPAGNCTWLTEGNEENEAGKNWRIPPRKHFTRPRLTPNECFRLPLSGFPLFSLSPSLSSFPSVNGLPEFRSRTISTTPCRRPALPPQWMFGVRCWMFNVSRLPAFRFPPSRLPLSPHLPDINFPDDPLHRKKSKSGRTNPFVTPALSPGRTLAPACLIRTLRAPSARSPDSTPPARPRPPRAPACTAAKRASIPSR